MFRYIAVTVCALIPLSQSLAVVANLEDKTLSPDSFFNGSDGLGGFTSQGVHFSNSHDPTFGNWSGFAYSNVNNTTTPGFGNQYSAYHLPSGGGDQSSQYGIAFSPAPGTARIELPAGSALHLTPPARFDCLADLRVRFADGRVEEHAREDLCQAQRVLRVPSAPR